QPDEAAPQLTTAVLTQPGTVAGTVAYMAPEQLRGDKDDVRTDIWSLGVTLYEMSAGRRPFEGVTTFEVSSAILSQSPRPLPDLAVRPVIDRCLQKDRALRYEHASDVARDLADLPRGTVGRRASAAWPRSSAYMALAALTTLAAILVFPRVKAALVRPAT